MMILKFKKNIFGTFFIILFAQNSVANIIFNTSFSSTIHSQASDLKNGSKCEVDELVTPNAFSPNADGVNDYFCLDGWQNCVSDFELFIFNRFGEIVFESKNPELCWDGSFKGKVLENTVLLFVVKAKTKSGTEFKKSGNITLIR